MSIYRLVHLLKYGDSTAYSASSIPNQRKLIFHQGGAQPDLL